MTSLRSLPRAFGLRVLVALATAALPVLLGACSQTPVTVDLHSLQASGNVTFVCRADDRTGHKLDECPDYEHLTRRTLGLVTQTATDEVAIVDLYAGAVVDVDPTTPGYTFLRVGARPGAIVTTPGGVASFVGVTGLQKNGIFALPTTCLSAPVDDQPARDLTTWSACALSSAPGDIAIVVDPPASDGTIRDTCSGEKEKPPAMLQAKRVCPADLSTEQGPMGRRKLLVSLPDEHKLVLLDAQSLLDRSPGEFQQCAVEQTFPLIPRIPKVIPQPVLPDDLQPAPGIDPNVCQKTIYPPPVSALPTPGGFAQATDRLYVADHTLPVVHVLDSSDPCAASELAPLFAESYAAPNRTVTTSRVAVSPLTPGGKQFVYAVDENDQPSASVMVFDVSPVAKGAAANPTPLIFPGAPRQPFFSPDRLQFNSPVKDVSFVMRDFPAPTDTGVGQFGLACDPYPNDGNALTCTRPGCQYRPNADFSAGARPLNLRGAFGFLMLKNGQVVITDVEDFDEPCRRPITTNASPFEDFRGCASDPPDPDQSVSLEFYTADNSAIGLPNVTNESSCHIIEPNRPRAASLSISNTTVGLRAPTLRSFPQFSNPDPSAVITPDKQPHLLAVDFANPDPSDPAAIEAQVNVSAQVYENCPRDLDGIAHCADVNVQPLDLNPRTAQQNSLVLPLIEPRSYPQEDAPALVFEGRVFPPRTSGFLALQDAAGNDLPRGQALLADPDANFCAAGVEDSDSIVNEAQSIGVPTGATQDAWALKHADYAEITGDFPADDDSYWTKGAGQACPRDKCENEFGNIDNPEVLGVSRDLSIIDAYGDHLLVSPRCQLADGTHDPKCDKAQVLNDIRCCFPTGTAYTVRASHQWLLGSLSTAVDGTSVFTSGRNDLATGSNGRCVHTASCDPRKKFFHVRAFEVCDQGAVPDGACEDDNVGCTVPGVPVPGVPPVTPGAGAPGSSCIFENLTSRFVVYRGAQPSTRGMSFSWQTTGGFVPLSMSLSTSSTQVSPQSMSYLPGYGYLAVIDAATLGLSLFDLNSLAVVSPSPYF
jgi:hypothetical protein